jgi:hypothetical protein
MSIYMTVGIYSDRIAAKGSERPLLLGTLGKVRDERQIVPGTTANWQARRGIFKH